MLEDPDLPMYAKVIGAHLALRMNAKRQVAWPNIKTMATVLGISARHAQRGMLALEKRNLVVVTRSKGHGNSYSIRLPSDP